MLLITDRGVEVGERTQKLLPANIQAQIKGLYSILTVNGDVIVWCNLLIYFLLKSANLWCSQITLPTEEWHDKRVILTAVNFLNYFFCHMQDGSHAGSSGTSHWLCPHPVGKRSEGWCCRQKGLHCIAQSCKCICCACVCVHLLFF